ncbi:protease inhibitor I42 family protein [Bacteroides timonensis]|uniref:protease inhibitor I42 family protein n=1 Tax=Bacteroides timonensis TaxID=1470345 RepID=UPI0004B3D07C|nr:protease inhibitor I42 family protein [Bacteroides timonensis]
MVRTFFKVGETMTVKRVIQAGTQSRYVLAFLSGSAALVSEEVEKAEQPGGDTTQTFTFEFMKPGVAQIQFAHFRGTEALYEEVLAYYAYDPAANGAETNDVNSFSTLIGSKVREEGDACVYFLQHDGKTNEKKRMGIPDMETFKRVFTKYDWQDIPSEIMQHIPRMENMDADFVGIFKCEDSYGIYFCTGRLRYFIPNMEVLNAIGFNLEKAYTLKECMIHRLFDIDAGSIEYKERL